LLACESFRVSEFRSPSSTDPTVFFPAILPRSLSALTRKPFGTEVPRGAMRGTLLAIAPPRKTQEVPMENA
jgi:hypothetical protein